MNLLRISRNRWLISGLLFFVFLLLNHCGLQAAVHQFQLEKKMSCHASAGPESSGSRSCEDESCCTKLRATAKESIRIELPQEVVTLFDRVVFSAEATGEPRSFRFERADGGPPHLSFKTNFCLEAFLSHAPPI